TLLAYWMSKKTPHTLYVIDPSPFNETRCRGAISQKVEIWRDENCLKVLPKKLGKGGVTRTEVLEFAEVEVNGVDTTLSSWVTAEGKCALTTCLVAAPTRTRRGQRGKAAP